MVVPTIDALALPGERPHIHAGPLRAAAIHLHACPVVDNDRASNRGDQLRPSEHTEAEEPRTVAIKGGLTRDHL
jgi:hypothetical protein